MGIPLPPAIPPQWVNSNDPELSRFVNELQIFLDAIYSKLRYYDTQDIAITTGTTAPVGGSDGDLYIRKDGALTALYLNINGTFSAYNNP